MKNTYQSQFTSESKILEGVRLAGQPPLNEEDKKTEQKANDELEKYYDEIDRFDPEKNELGI